MQSRPRLHCRGETQLAGSERATIARVFHAKQRSLVPASLSWTRAAALDPRSRSVASPGVEDARCVGQRALSRPSQLLNTMSVLRVPKINRDAGWMDVDRWDRLGYASDRSVEAIGDRPVRIGSAVSHTVL